MKVLVCGGRDYDNVLYLRGFLDAIHLTRHIEFLIHGAAKGADFYADLWAKSRNVPVVEFPADWNTYGRRAGYVRNVTMIEQSPDLVIAFPGGRGTHMMIDIALQRHVEILNIEEIQK